MVKRTPDLDPVYQEKLALYQRLVQTIPEVACKGDKNPYTHPSMDTCFSYLHPSERPGVAIGRDRSASISER